MECGTGIFLEHKYVRVPFTNVRLVFEEGKYIGWYKFKY